MRRTLRRALAYAPAVGLLVAGVVVWAALPYFVHSATPICTCGQAPVCMCPSQPVSSGQFDPIGPLLVLAAGVYALAVFLADRSRRAPLRPTERTGA